MDTDLENARSKLTGLLGVQLESEEAAKLLAEIIAAGGGVNIEIDELTRFRLIRREGKFVLTNASRNRGSSFPPRR